MEEAEKRLRHLYAELVTHVVEDPDLSIVETESTRFTESERSQEASASVRFLSGEEDEQESARVSLVLELEKAQLHYRDHSPGPKWDLKLDSGFGVGEKGSIEGEEPEPIMHRSAREAAAWLLGQVKGRLPTD